MDFLSLANARCSVRDYLDAPLDAALVERVLEAGRLAPSACNNQPTRFIVLSSADSRRKLESIYPRPWLRNAPVVIAACCDRTVSWRRSDGKDYGEVDAAIALDYVTLAATDAGLGTCWIAAFNALEARKLLMLPDHIDPIAFTPLGYPGPHHSAGARKTRRKLDEIVSWEYYGGRKQ